MGVTGNKRERAEGTKGIKDRNKWKQRRQRSESMGTRETIMGVNGEKVIQG